MKEVYVVKMAKFRHPSLKNRKIMKIEVEVSQEVLAAVMDGKCVEGRLRLQLSSMGTHQEIGFSPYNRKPKGSLDKTIVELETGWLKESPKRIKFFSSVKKELDLMTIDHVMKRELKTAMRALLGDKLMEMLLEDISFEIPAEENDGKIVIDRAFVQEKFSDTVHRDDVDKYIL